MKKFKCDITGVESEWVDDSQTPEGWIQIRVSPGHMSGRTNLPYMLINCCPEVHERFRQKAGEVRTKSTEEEMIELLREWISEEVNEAVQDR